MVRPILYFFGLAIQGGALSLLIWSLTAPFHGSSGPTPAIQARPFVPKHGYQPTGIPCTAPNQTTTALNTSAHVLPEAANDVDPSIGPAWQVPHGDFNMHPNATLRLWLGPLGSCSRDEDRRRWCTKPSYPYPMYNISLFIEPNPFITSDTIRSETFAQTTFAFIILTSLGILLSVPAVIREWRRVPVVYIVFLLKFSIIALSLMGNTSEMRHLDPRRYNNASRFYVCDTATGVVGLKSSTQFYIVLGNHYGLLWGSIYMSFFGVLFTLVGGD